jgi:hypothetical protein
MFMIRFAAGRRNMHCDRQGGLLKMFDPENVREEFEKFLSVKGLHQHDLTLADGCEAVFDFYCDLKPRGRVFEQEKGADMLLFQWGTYDWGTGEYFGFNLTRQLIGEGPVDDAMRQLGLTFEFQPVDELRALGIGDKWCDSLSALPEFREYVYRSPAFTTCTTHQILRTVIDYQAGD